jgi:hypothetical protein
MPSRSAGAICWRAALAHGHLPHEWHVGGGKARLPGKWLGPHGDRRQAAALCVDAGVDGHSAGLAEGMR